MRALIVSNCATRAYRAFLAGLFEEWDVRAALHTTARSWLRDGNPEFVAFARSADVLCIIDTAKDLRPQLAGPGTKICDVPNFVFMGTRPDCFWLNGVTSPTKSGHIHSRIAASAYAQGRSAKEAEALFCAEHFAALGYLTAQDREIDKTLAPFRACGLELAPHFETWRQSGDFLYTPNHPRVQVFCDILETALRGIGLLETVPAERIATLKTEIEDYLSQGIIWPVFDEVAHHAGVTSYHNRWRESGAKGSGQAFDLSEMIARSYAAFADHPDARRRIAAALGGEPAVRSYAGG